MVPTDVMSIVQSVPFDDNITNMEWHTHLPYASMTLGNSDEIRIPIQQQDLCVVPAMSYLHVEGRLLLDGDAATVPTNTRFVNNAFAHLFDELRYELNGVEIDRVRNPGVSTTLKGYVSLNDGNLKTMGNAAWSLDMDKLDTHVVPDSVDGKGNFSFCVPLDKLFGFAEDYRKMVVNARHELVLVRSPGDKNALLTKKVAEGAPAESAHVKLTRLAWRVPYVTLSDKQRISLLRLMDRGTSVPVEYRSWEMHEYPMLPKATRHTWTVKTGSVLEKPRYVIVAFQTARKNVTTTSASVFDHCNLTNLKLHLNSSSYPYDDLKLNFSTNQYAVLYDMYARFQESYYNTWMPRPLLSRKQFYSMAPIAVIDCSKQNESIRNAPVDIRLEFETSEAIPADTSAYCLVIYDRSFTYEPATGMVQKLV